jgi:hypothetical protein
MKKLTYLASAIAAGFSANAVADVSVSGSGNAAYVSDAAGEGNVTVGSSVDFGLSTTTANGITISTGLSITVTVDGDGAATAGGGQSLTFAGDGATVVVGDISVADTPGSVAGVIGGALAENEASKGAGFDTDVAEAFDDDDGMGVSLSTSAAGASISVAYVFDTAATSNSMSNVDSTNSSSSFGVTVPMGDFSVSAGVASHDSGESAAGGSISAKLGAGTLKIGYSQQTMVIDASADVTTGFVTTLATDVTSATSLTDLSPQQNELIDTTTTQASSAAIHLADYLDVTVANTMANTASAQDADMAGDTSVFSAAYSMALDADTSFATSYKNAQDAEGESYTQFEVSISRSLGGGASVYIDMANISGDLDDANDGSAFGFGTSVSF